MEGEVISTDSEKRKEIIRKAVTKAIDEYIAKNVLIYYYDKILLACFWEEGLYVIDKSSVYKLQRRFGC